MSFTINDITIIQKVFGFISGISKLYYEYVNSIVLSEGEIAPNVFFELLVKTLFFCVIIFIICLGKILQIGNLSVSVIINTIINVFNFITNKYQNNNLQELEEIQNEINEQSILLYNQLRERIEHNDTLHNERIEQYVNEILRQEEIRRLQREEEIRNLRLQSRLQSIIRHNQILNSMSSKPPEPFVNRIASTNLSKKTNQIYSNRGGGMAVKHKNSNHKNSSKRQKKPRKSNLKGGEGGEGASSNIINSFINCLVLTFVYEFKKNSIMFASNNKINTNIFTPFNNLTESDKIMVYFSEIVEKIQTTEELQIKQQIINKYFYNFIQENTIFDKVMKEKVINIYTTVFENPKGGYRKIKQTFCRKNKNNKTKKHL